MEKTRCHYKYCKQYVFITFDCKKCRLKYCSEHRTPREHECENDYSDFDRGEAQPFSEKTRDQCSFCKCRLLAINKFDCSRCQSRFCIKHRHPEIHKCQPVQSKQKDIQPEPQLNSEQRQGFWLMLYILVALILIKIAN